MSERTKGMSVEQERSPRLSDKVYASLLSGIVDSTYPRNKNLPTEHELAKQFGVSRTVVRQAIVRLREDGLVQSRQGSGTLVLRRPNEAMLQFAPVSSIADIRRCFEFRSKLEGGAAEFAALHHDSAALEALENALSSHERIIANSVTGEPAVRDVAQGVEADSNFHMAVARASMNHFFVLTLESVRTQVLFGMNLAHSLNLLQQAELLRTVYGEHSVIYENIRDRNAQGAREAMELHIARTRQRMFESPQGMGLVKELRVSPNTGGGR